MIFDDEPQVVQGGYESARALVGEGYKNPAHQQGHGLRYA
jgi:hypothetical protein